MDSGVLETNRSKLDRPLRSLNANRFDLTWLAVSREEVFSPGKVGEDGAILRETMAALVSMGYSRPRLIRAEELERISDRPRYVLSMAQSEPALAVLQRLAQQGTRVINSIESVRNCYRGNLIRLLAAGGVPMPLSRMMPLAAICADTVRPGVEGCWLKRGDFHALRSADVVRATSAAQLGRALAYFRAEGVQEVLVQEHVDGEVVKFYGTGPGDYFEAFLESSGRRIFPVDHSLMEVARRAAELAGLEIFGGDAVVTARGEVVLIDLNDWPSFSRCRGAAAARIAGYATRECAGGCSRCS